MMDKSKLQGTAAGVVWDLGDVYPEPGDVWADQDLEEAGRKTGAFVKTFCHSLNERIPDTDELLQALKAYETIQRLGLRACLYGYLRYASNTLDEGRTAFFRRIKDQWRRISEDLLFFERELIFLPGGRSGSMAESPEMTPYAPYLLRLRRRKPYTLSEPEEKDFMRQRSVREAFGIRYQDLMANLSLPLDLPGGERRRTTAEEALALLHSHDRNLRETSFKALLEALGRQGAAFKDIFNDLLLGMHQEKKRRGCPTAMQSSLLSSEVDGALIEQMMKTVEAHYGLARRYFRLKARLLGRGRLRTTDLSAPLGKPGPLIPFKEARRVLLDLAQSLHPLFHSRLLQAFEGGWIDAETRQGKMGGAFCKCLIPDLHPYISTHYAGHFRDLAVLAHELGHAVHYGLAAVQNILNFEPAPLVAETASTFMELALTRHLLENEPFRMERTPLLAHQLDGFITTIFRQTVLTRFELALHGLREDRPLTEEEICRFWLHENQQLYGPDVETAPGYRWAWTTIPHLVHRPFYCYNYIFGNLLAIRLFENYQRDRAFLEEVIGLLRAGSSRPPLERLRAMDLDPNQGAFWDKAFETIEGCIDRLESES